MKKRALWIALACALGLLVGFLIHSLPRKRPLCFSRSIAGKIDGDGVDLQFNINNPTRDYYLIIIRNPDNVEVTNFLVFPKDRSKWGVPISRSNDVRNFTVLAVPADTYPMTPRYWLERLGVVPVRSLVFPNQRYAVAVLEIPAP